MLPQNNPDGIGIVFDGHRLVANAGLLLPATLAQHLGLRELVDHHLDLGSAPGRANTGDKMMTLVASALAGDDCIDDADALRTGGTARVAQYISAAYRGSASAGGNTWQWSIWPEPFWPLPKYDNRNARRGSCGGRMAGYIFSCPQGCSAQRHGRSVQDVARAVPPSGMAGNCPTL